MTIVLGKEDKFIISLILNKYKKQVVRAGYKLKFKGNIQLKFDLKCAINVL